MARTSPGFGNEGHTRADLDPWEHSLGASPAHKTGSLSSKRSWLVTDYAVREVWGSDEATEVPREAPESGWLGKKEREAAPLA